MSCIRLVVAFLALVCIPAQSSDNSVLKKLSLLEAQIHSIGDCSTPPVISEFFPSDQRSNFFKTECLESAKAKSPEELMLFQQVFRSARFFLLSFCSFASHFIITKPFFQKVMADAKIRMEGAITTIFNREKNSILKFFGGLSQNLAILLDEIKKGAEDDAKKNQETSTELEKIAQTIQNNLAHTTAIAENVQILEKDGAFLQRQAAESNEILKRVVAEIRNFFAEYEKLENEFKITLDSLN